MKQQWPIAAANTTQSAAVRTGGGSCEIREYEKEFRIEP